MILIAEDQSICSTLLKIVLEKAGYQVRCADNGRRAYEILKEEGPFEALITDWMMPQFDGIQLIRAVRQSIHPTPAIMMVSTLSTEESKSYALDSGADDFVEKPYEPDHLLEVLERCLARKRQSDQGLPVFDIEPFAAMAPPPELLQPIALRSSLGVVGLTANTGGAAAYHQLFKTVPVMPDTAFFVILQAPVWALEVFMMRLQKVTAMKVCRAEDGMPIRGGQIYIAPRDRHLVVDERGQKIRLMDAPPENYVRPSADVLFHSLSQVFGPKAMAVVLTGIGHDGLHGAHSLAEAGGQVFVQDPATAEAPTQPQAAASLDISKQILPLEMIGPGLAQATADLTRLEGEGTFQFMTPSPGVGVYGVTQWQ